MSVDSSGNGHRLKQLAPRYPRAAFGWFYGINNSKDWEIVVERLGGLGINFAHIMQMNLGMNKLAPSDTKESILMWG